MPRPEITPAPTDLMEGAPTGFSRFSFPGGQLRAQLLNRYLWDFFKNRAVNVQAPYYKEYLQIADLWLTAANEPHTGVPIQQTHATELSEIFQDVDGYLSSHQVLSCAHDLGWPFPVWCWPDGFSGHATACNWSGPYGLPALFPNWKLPDSPFIGERALIGWTTQNMQSRGIVDNHWELESTGPSPSITSPEGWIIDSFCAPFIQLRGVCTTDNKGMEKVVLQWQRKGDREFNSQREVPMVVGKDNLNAQGLNYMTNDHHLTATLHRHPLYKGEIKRLRVVFTKSDGRETYCLNNMFTAYDTRHPINCPIFIVSCWMQYQWTGDVVFLRQNVLRMRRTLAWQQTELNTLRFQHVRNTITGHDGLPGFKTLPGGKKQIEFGHGIGNNYFDVCPFGYDDAYATSQYYRSVLVMVEMEEAVAQHPEWRIEREMAFNPHQLHDHAAKAKDAMNRKFWDDKKGRFIACIDQNGKKWDFGYTFLNIEAITNGIATPEHAKRILEWLDGKHIVAGDTSTSSDIYAWRFGPRVSTVRNTEWYAQGWFAPENVPWGGQVQDGGGVLGFSYFDLLARLRTAGPDNAWKRLVEILEWEKEVRDAGGYRDYYKKLGVTLQGGGTEGGIGIDFEFLESSMIPAIIPLGFMGLQPMGDGLAINPQMPSAQPEMALHGLLFRGSELDVQCSNQQIIFRLRKHGKLPVILHLPEGWRDVHGRQVGSARLFAEGEFVFTKK
ncbi:MAG: glycosyl hydrolase family 65 protein [Armatimonadota bacterium]